MNGWAKPASTEQVKIKEKEEEEVALEIRGGTDEFQRSM